MSKTLKETLTGYHALQNQGEHRKAREAVQDIGAGVVLTVFGVVSSAAIDLGSSSTMPLVADALVGGAAEGVAAFGLVYLSCTIDDLRAAAQTPPQI